MRKTFLTIISIILLAALFSACAGVNYKKYADDITDYSMADLIEAFTELKDYKDSAEVLQMLQALDSREFARACELYAAYRAGEEKAIKDDKQWLDLMRENLYSTKEAKANPPAPEKFFEAYRLGYAPYMHTLDEFDAYDEDAYLFTRGTPENIQLFFKKEYCRLGFDSLDALKAACGAKAAGKLIIVVNSEAKNSGIVDLVDITSMLTLPEKYFPTSLNEVEYMVRISYERGNVGTYNTGAAAVRESIRVTLEHLPDGEILFENVTVGGMPPNTTRVPEGSTLDITGKSPDWPSAARDSAHAVCMAIGGSEGDFDYIVRDGGAVILNYRGEGGDVTVPDTLGGYPVRIIGAPAFSGDTWWDKNDLTSLTLPDSVEKTAEYAFSYNKGLESITFGSGLIEIGSRGLYRCESLTALELPEGLSRLGDSALDGLIGLRSIYIPQTLTDYGDNFNGRNMNHNEDGSLIFHGPASAPAKQAIIEGGYNWQDE